MLLMLGIVGSRKVKNVFIFLVFVLFSRMQHHVVFVSGFVQVTQYVYNQ